MKIDSKLQDIFLAKFVYRREFDNRAVILEKNKKNSSPCGYSSNFWHESIRLILFSNQAGWKTSEMKHQWLPNRFDK